MSGKAYKICVLMTAHNRRELTVRSLDALANCRPSSGELSVVLVDAGSTDGTAEAVAKSDVVVTVISAGADIYWNAGMRLAWSHAISTPPDFFLWLNDDLALLPDSLDGLVQSYEAHAARTNGKAIVVGKTVSERDGSVTYGGYRRAAGISSIRWRRLVADEAICDTMNGNCVLFPASVVTDIGINAAEFQHALGDIDYGLRARRAGYEIIEHGNPVGFQEKNAASVYTGARLPLTLKNIRTVLASQKGFPPRQWMAFCRRHAGLLWPLNFVMRYLNCFYFPLPRMLRFLLARERFLGKEKA